MIRSRALLPVCGFLGVSAAQAAPLDVLRVREPVAGQYLVVLREPEHRDLLAAASLREEIEQRFGVRADRAYRAVLPGFAATLTTEEAARLARDPRVAYVQEDGIVRAHDTQADAPWGLDRVDQGDLPLSSNYRYDYTGAGVTAFIVDTGIRSTHIDFSGRIGTGFTAYADGNGTEDCNGHGTHVAGTVGGSITGIAKDVTLVAVRVLDCNGSGTLSNVIDGLDWIAQNATLPAVANMSLGGGQDTALRQAVERLVDAGVVTVVSAGNDNVDACTQTPADAPSAITVGATNDSDTRASFSNFGTCVDIFAPGVDIFSAYHTADNAAAEVSGTSQASPHVAGFAALLLERYPSATPAEITARILDGAAEGKVSSAGAGSPTRLLSTRFVGFEADATTGPAPFEVRFTNTGNAGATYLWDFGDGEDSTSPQPSHVFEQPGEYVVTLTMDGSLESDPVTIVVTEGDGTTPLAPEGTSRLDGGYSCSVGARAAPSAGGLLALLAGLLAVLVRRR